MDDDLLRFANSLANFSGGGLTTLAAGGDGVLRNRPTGPGLPGTSCEPLAPRMTRGLLFGPHDYP